MSWNCLSQYPESSEIDKEEMEWGRTGLEREIGVALVEASLEQFGMGTKVIVEVEDLEVKVEDLSKGMWGKA